MNVAFVRQFLRGEQPLGKRINAIMDSQNPYGQVIGVVADVCESTIDHEPEPPVYYPHAHLSYPRVQGQFATLYQGVDGFLRKWVRLQVPKGSFPRDAGALGTGTEPKTVPLLILAPQPLI